ncbi:MAG: hypothetical protein VW683_12965 [Betaproteobacteria bacterium]
MKVTKAKLKAIINEELQAELNEGVIDFFKRLFGVAKPTEDAKAYLTRLDAAIVNNPDFKGHTNVCKHGSGTVQLWCPEKDKCSPYCGKNPFEMKKKIKYAADQLKLANRAT